MHELTPNLFVGNSLDAKRFKGSVISACQSAHYKRHGWDRKRPPRQDNPNYLVREKQDWLTINWVDGPAKYYEWTGVGVWHQAYRFIDDARRNGHPVLVHCDKGQSRSPSLVLAYLAWRGELPSDYEDAVSVFRAKYPDYAPGGIAEWMKENWNDLISKKEDSDGS